MVEVSVVIPSYNHGHFLDECLASVLGQEGVNFEVILVDDGSTDDTHKVASRFRDRITYLRQDNAGLSAARNTGLRASRGHFVQFLDADDLLAPGCLSAKLSAMAKENERSILVCRNRLFTKVNRRGRADTRGRWGLYTTNLDLHLCRLNIAPPHAYFINRDLIKNVGEFDESYKGCEDYDFWLRALGAGFHFKYCPDAEVYYRRHPQSMGQAKAKAGAFPFDVMVHQRKHLGDYGQGVADIIATPVGKLALADGMMRTAARINPDVNPGGRDELLRMACDNLNSAIADLSVDDSDLNFEVRLYLRRIGQLYMQAFRSLESVGIQSELGGIAKRCASLGGRTRDLKAIFPFNAYEKQLLTYAMLGLAVARGRIPA